MRRFLAAVAALIASANPVFAQEWPAKPVRMVVSLPPGSATDIVGRALAEKLTRQLGQPFIVENKPGASGSIAQALVAKADPDGYTILVHSSSATVVPFTIDGLPFDVQKDFSGVTMLASMPNVLVTSPAKGYRSVRGLVAAAKASPGALDYATVGTGSATHLNAERFRLGAGIRAEQVPYRGTGEALSDLLAGRVDYCFCPLSNVLPLLKDGRLTALAVGSSRRAPSLPDTPTTEEAGVPNSAYNFYVALSVSSKVSPAIVNKLHAHTVRALQSPEMAERYAHLGAALQIFTPQEFDAYLRNELISNAELVRVAGVKTK